MTTIPDSVEAGPFDVLSRAEMREHLTRHHNASLLAKATRGEMQATHDRMHSNNRMVVAHTHVPADPGDSAFTDSPLSATEQRNVKQLVDNEFASLTAEMEVFCADMLESELATIEEEFTEKNTEGNDALADIKRVVARAQAEVQQIIDDARSRGVQVSGIDDYTWRNLRRDHSFTLPSKDERVAKAKERNRALIKRTNLTIERQRLRAQRRVLLSSISDDGQRVLDSIPSARDLMVAAQADQAQIGA